MAGSIPRLSRDEKLDSLPPLPGYYAVHFFLPAAVCLTVGRSGTFFFPAGDLAYLGSANGPGGVRARLRHHLAPAARPHWHIDFLRPHCILRAVAYAVQPPGGDRLECAWSQALARQPGAAVPAPGFGSADCHAGCPAHLVAFAEGLTTTMLEETLRWSTSGRATVEIWSVPLDAQDAFP